MKKFILFIMIGMTAGLMNCSTDMKVCVKEVAAATIAAVPQVQLNTDIARIKTYTNAIGAANVVEDPSGLRYSITTIGTGDTPCLSSIVTIAYSGKVLLQPNNNSLGTAFDASASADFNLSDLILGWQIAFPKFPAGTQATLYIPSGLAYGTRAQGAAIPANSVLVFEVNLIRFQ